ncbi:MAG: glycosyl hydrolase, partial [Phycisphaerales bacterium]
LISVTEDSCATWRKVERLEGVPDRTYVSDLEASRHDESVVYAAFDAHKNGDFKPYLFRSADKGATWTSIAGDLPANNVCYSIAEDHKLPGLLFVGTEYGAYYTLDGGKKWIKIGGLPVIAVRDIDVQRRENDLVLGTFGRGIYIVNDYSPLHAASDELLLKPAAFFPVKPALSFPTRSRLGYGGRGWSGATYWTAPNPAFGATFTYHVKDKTPTLREQRIERQDKPDWKYPTMEEFRTERNELEPEFFLTIRDGAGEVVRRIPAPRGPGIHRTTWDLRRVTTAQSDGSLGGPAGHPVPPGKYTVTLSRIKDASTEDLAGPEPFEVVEARLNPNAADAEAWAAKEAFRSKVEGLQRAMNASARVLGELDQRVTTIRRAVTQTPGASLELLKGADALRNRLRTVREALYGDPELDRRVEPDVPSLFARVGFAANGVSESTEPVTASAREQYEFAAAGFEPQLEELRRLETEVSALAAEADRAGAPWTGGGLPDWKR